MNLAEVTGKTTHEIINGITKTTSGIGTLGKAAAFLGAGFVAYQAISNTSVDVEDGTNKQANSESSKSQRDNDEKAWTGEDRFTRVSDL